MAETKKYFLDFGGLQTLWAKMKSTFASKSDVETLEGIIGTISGRITGLEEDIQAVQDLTLSYKPKVVSKYSDALTMIGNVDAGQLFIVENDETDDNDLDLNVLYRKGFYLLDNDKALHFIGTSVGGSDSEIAALRDRIVLLEGQIIKSANIQAANGTSPGGITIADNSLIIINDDEVVANSKSVNALTHRAVAAKFAELEGDFKKMISNIPKFKIEPVEALPEMGWSLSTIYLLKNNTEQDKNLYTEYIYVEGKGWEKLGEQTIVLDDYVTKEFLTASINSALAEYAKTADVEAFISTAKTEILNTVAETYATKDELEAFMTEAEIIDSIQTGTIGNEITIREDQINSLS